MRRIVIAGRKGMPCPYTTGVRIRPWLSAPVCGSPPTMSKLSLTEINRLLLFSCAEVAPPLLSIARVLVVPSVPSPVEVGPSQLSPVTDTTALEFPSVSVPVETGITDASHAACSKSVVGIAPVSVSKTLPSVGYPPAGWTSQRSE